MLQSPLVTALRHRALTDPASVIKEIEAMMKVTNGQPCAARSKLSVSEGHQLRTLHGDLFFECTSGGSGPVTRSRKRAPVGISYLESPPMVTIPPSVGVPGFNQNLKLLSKHERKGFNQNLKRLQSEPETASIIT